MRSPQNQGTNVLDNVQNNQPDDSHYDSVIIGGGPAGTTAAMYIARAGLKAVVIDKGLTVGALGITGKIANYPGIVEEISGTELLVRMRQQAQSFGAQYIPDKVIGVDLNSDEKAVFTNNGVYNARSVIIATGSMGRSQLIQGEDTLLGRGVSYCATCDGAFFHDQDVLVAGSSDEAIEEALFLTKFARRVYFISPTKELKAPQGLIDTMLENQKVALYKGASLREIIGIEQVEAVRFAQRGQSEQTLPVSGVFLYLQGSQPITDFIQGQLTATEKGCLVVDHEYSTAVPGVFAVGDVLCNHVKQAVVAAAEGAVAGMAVEKMLRQRKQIAVDWSKN